MKIDGLSKADVELLDIMLQLDTEEELYKWLKRQLPGVQKRAKVLIELAVMADREEGPLDKDTLIGQIMLKKIGVKC
jgi:predicted transcriptional regulator